MGGGPEEEVEEVAVAYPVVEQQQQVQVVEETGGLQERKDHPILSTMAAGGVFGGIVGSAFGMGSILGSTTGVIVAATVASRDDAMGAKARSSSLYLKEQVEKGVSQMMKKLNEQELGRDISTRVNATVKALSDAEEKYRVTQRINGAMVTVFERAEPHVQTLYKKAVEADTNGYIPKVQEFLGNVDKVAGISRSVDAVRRELKN